MLHAIIFMNAAFILYTIGVWSEKIQGKLKLWHLLMFWLGLASDIMGTLAMEAIVRQNSGDVSATIAHMNFHSITGTFALALMVLHAVWATIVLIKNQTVLIKKFHQYSLFVWIVWLIPFLTGAIHHG